MEINYSKLKIQSKCENELPDIEPIITVSILINVMQHRRMGMLNHKIFLPPKPM